MNILSLIDEQVGKPVRIQIVFATDSFLASSVPVVFFSLFPNCLRRRAALLLALVQFVLPAEVMAATKEWRVVAPGVIEPVPEVLDKSGSETSLGGDAVAPPAPTENQTIAPREETTVAKTAPEAAVADATGADAVPVLDPRVAERLAAGFAVAAEPAATGSEIAKSETEKNAAEDDTFLRELVGGDGTLSLPVVSGGHVFDVQTPVQIDEAVAFALRNNLEVKAADAKNRSAYWDKMGAYAQYVPTMEFSYANGHERSMPASFNTETGDRALNDIHRRHDRNFSVRLPIIDLGIISDIIAGHDRQRATEYGGMDVQEGIAFDTAVTFLKLLQSRIAIKLADQYRQYLDDLAARMEKRVQGGAGTQTDLDRIRGRSSLADAARVEAIGEFETNFSEFQRLTKIVPAQLQVPKSLAPAIPADFTETLQAAVKNNPSYRAALGKIDAAVADRNKSLSSMLPKLSAQYSHQYSFNAGGSAKGNPIDGVYPTQTSNSMFLVMQWNLNSGTPVTTALSSVAKQQEERYKADDAIARIEQSIKSSYTALNAARQRIDILRTTVATNERVVAGTEEQYQAGGRSLFDLLDAYEQLYNARLNLMRVVIAKAQAQYMVQKQMGNLIPSLVNHRRVNNG